MTETDVRRHLGVLMTATLDRYTNLNAVRDWVNATYPAVELYLEDVWNDHAAGETHFEYILRSRQTLEETPVLAVDVYLNHQDAKGVWHLGDYVESRELVPVVETVTAFLTCHGCFEMKAP